MCGSASGFQAFFHTVQLTSELVPLLGHGAVPNVFPAGQLGFAFFHFYHGAGQAFRQGVQLPFLGDYALAQGKLAQMK